MAGEETAPLRQRLAAVLDPELDEPILELGFVRELRVEGGRAEIVLQLPTSWCAVNFAWLMASDVRAAALATTGIRAVTIRLGDHCAAAEIEAAVNAGRAFADAFPGEAGGGLAALRHTFLRKGFLARQERLLRQLRDAGLSSTQIGALRVGDLSEPADPLRRYMQRRRELGLDCGAQASLIVDLDGAPIAADRLAAFYRDARTVRVAMEANGSLCRALLATRRAAGNTNRKEETDVPA